MEALIVLVFLVQALIQYPQMVGDELDEATRVRMEQRAEFLNREMSRLLQELEQSTLERTLRAWGALLWAVLQQGHFWALVGVLSFLSVLWFRLRKRCCELHSSGPQENASSNLEVEEDEEKGNVVAKKEGKSDDANVEEDSKDGNAEDGGRVDTNEDDDFGNEERDKNEDETGEEVNNDMNVEEINKAGNSEDGSRVDTNKDDNFGNEGRDKNEDETGEEVNDDMNVEEVNKDGNSEDGSRVDTNEENEGKDETEDENEDKVIGSVNVEEANATGREENGDEEEDIESKIGRFIEECIRWPLLDRGCMITDLIDDFTRAFGRHSSIQFYPVLQRAIGVGSAFEGWSPLKDDVVYRVLVPLTPPPGYSFHLELDTAGKMPGKNFYIRVKQVCTSTREQQGKKALHFLHNPEEELRRNEERSLIYNLCTRSYLDVEKTTQWFYLLMKANWLRLPQSYHWRLKSMPSSRSCKFRLTKGMESLQVEVLFGVQQGDSDIYVSSQPTEALFTPSTVWPETYAVAETKFFSHIARQAPQDSCHLKCLQLLTRTVVSTAFSHYTLKTVMMHLLNTTPMSQWCRRDFLQRLVDILDYLRCSLQKKHLDCFVMGNQSMPAEINLPPHFRTAKPLNLFWHLAQDPDAHTEAMEEYLRLRNRLRQLLLTIIDI